MIQAAERLETIARQCRTRSYAFPESLITAICQYASGEGSLTTIQQEWKAANHITRFLSERFIVISDPNAEQLDEMDLRVLDICIAVGCVDGFFQHISMAGPVEQARDYLLARGTSEPDILRAILACYQFLDRDEKPNAVGRLLLTCIPEHFQEMLKNFPTRTWSSSRQGIFRLLMIVQPGDYLDLAWQVAQTAQLNEMDDYAAVLLKADPARFTEWTRQVVKTLFQNHENNSAALEALLAHDPARHIDLALEAAHAPLGPYSRYRWSNATIQRLGIDAAYRLDPVKYLSVVEEAAVARSPDLSKHAVELLKDADFEQARPILQRCVASGDIDAALNALDVLLEQQWPERQAYLFSLLSHRSKPLRDALIGGLVKEGESMIEPLAPSLAHPNADARLTVVLALQRIGGERARALLASRLDAEKSLKVKQAILDAVGVATLADSLIATSASPSEALTAEAEAALKRIAKPALPWFDAAQMPGLRWQDGAPVPQAVLRYLLYCQSRIKLSELDERVAKALPLVERSSMGDLALALFSGWIGQGAKSANGWCLPLVCALADERLILPLRQSIDGWAKGTRGAMAAKAVAAMALIESDLALAEINNLAERAKHSQMKAAAKKALTDAAAQRNISLEELADLIVPALDFDERGERVFDYGSRQFTVHLRLDQTIQLADSAGKRLTTLPKPGARDDESKAKAALAAWSLLKKQVPQVVKMQTERLENALITQRGWSIARWQALFLNHPVLRSFAITLVWGIVTPGQVEYQTIFRPLEDGSLTDAEDTAVTLPSEGIIRVAHPVELDEEARGAWLQHLADYEVTPPFPQLNRSLVRVSPQEGTALRWEKYQGYLMNGAALKGRYTKAGWERGSVQDGGVYHTIWKAFPAAGIQAVLETAGLAVGNEQGVTTAIKRLAFARIDTIKRGSYVYDDLKEQDERIIPLGNVPPIVFSEIAADVQSFAAAGEYSKDWEQKVW